MNGTLALILSIIFFVGTIAACWWLAKGIGAMLYGIHRNYMDEIEELEWRLENERKSR